MAQRSKSDPYSVYVTLTEDTWKATYRMDVTWGWKAATSGD